MEQITHLDSRRKRRVSWRRSRRRRGKYGKLITYHYKKQTETTYLDWKI